MKAEMAAKGMKSTIHPQRMSPIKQIIAPAMTASADATTCPGIEGSFFAALDTILPTIVEATATGYRLLNKSFSMPSSSEDLPLS